MNRGKGQAGLRGTASQGGERLIGDPGRPNGALCQGGRGA